MFTGIIECVGEIRSVVSSGSGKRITLDASHLGERPSLGASIAVNGVCLTVAEVTSHSLGFDVIQETLRRTNLGTLRPGQTVNLEPSLRIGDRLDGHFVQGHIDGTGVIRRVLSNAQEHLAWIEPEAELRDYITPKGSVSVDGISLTVADSTQAQFSVAIIPTTLVRTNLGARRAGDTVNLETDMLVRALVHYLRRAHLPESFAASAVTSEPGP